MTSIDGIAAAARFRDARDALLLACGPAPTDAGDVRTLDRYMDLRAALPCPDHLRDEWMAATQPALAEAVEGIQRRLHDRAADRRHLAEEADAALDDALTEMGVHWGARIASRVAEDPAVLVAPLVEDAYREASAFRAANLDGGRLAFDPDGPFTRSLHAAVAGAKGIPTRGSAWLRRVVERLDQHAFAVVSCPPERVADLELAGLAPSAVPMPQRGDGRVGMALRLRPDEIVPALDLLRSDPDAFELDGPYVSDPHFRFPNTGATDDAVVARPVGGLDAAELDGRRVALLWEASGGYGSASMRAMRLLDADAAQVGPAPGPR